MSVNGAGGFFGVFFFWCVCLLTPTKMSDQPPLAPPSFPHVLLRFLMLNSKRLQMYFLSGTHCAKRPAQRLYAERVGGEW